MFGKIAKPDLKLLPKTEEHGMTNPILSHITIAEAVVRREGIVFADRN